MLTNDLFIRLCEERNISESTQKGYVSALKNYENFHKMSINELLYEAKLDEKNNISLKDRNIKKRLVDYRTYLFKADNSPNTIRTYFTKVKTFYRHFEIELPILPDAKYNKTYEINYLDLPTKEHIREALDIVSIDLKSIILFMSSSGTAKAETLSLTVEQFVDGTRDYHKGGSLNQILDTLSKRNDVIPTFYVRRIKTDKFYYTFCSSEATRYIVTYLKTRKNLKFEDKLFDITPSALLSKFQEINDTMGWGFKGKYRFFRSHTLRKFHASNIGLSAEYIDLLQGRTRTELHETYIKINPNKLKQIYKSAMSNVMISTIDYDKRVQKQEFTIVVNVFLSGKEYNII